MQVSKMLLDVTTRTLYTFRSEDETSQVILFDPNEGEFSQWYPAKCSLDGIEFNCAEQLMMYAKASK